jgi:hypothetical protein
MKESVLTALSGWLRANNFDGKREFVSSAFNGLGVLADLVAEPAASPKLKWKALTLVYDLCIHDDQI